MSEHSDEHVEPPTDGEAPQTRLNEVAQKFLADLDEERQRLEENFPLCAFLVDDAVERVHATGRIPGKEYLADVYKQKPIKISQKVFVPTKQYPKFNFVGKLLGPKGNSLRRLEEETQCRIAIKGRNSMRDRVKEEELRNSNDPRYAHLSKDLFVEISAVTTPAEGYARVAYALAEIRKYLVPDKNDEVSHDQLREMMEIDPTAAKTKPNVASFLNKYGPGRKPETGSSLNKYLNYVKNSNNTHDSYEAEEEEVVSGYGLRMGKRPPPSSGYENIKGKKMVLGRVTSALPMKRHSAAYDMKAKRFRESSEKDYKHSQYGTKK